MMRRAYLVVGIATAALLTTLIVASTTSGALFGPQPKVVHQLPPGLRGRGQPPKATAASNSQLLPTWMVILITVFLLVLCVGLFLLVVTSQWGRKERRARSRLGDDVPPEGDDWRAAVGVYLADAAEEQLGELLHGTPRNAIVACWMRLQTASEAAGLQPLPSETAREFTVRALHRLNLDATAITTLSELYREARFSEHEMDEAQRDLARGALGVLSDQLLHQHSQVEAQA